MSRQATRDTAPEIALRRELFRRGLRYRVHCRPIPAMRRTADIVFRNARVAVMVDGCFWHGCPDHGTSPKANGEWWAAKLQANRARDLDTNAQLTAAGWQIVRIWEHESASSAADQVEQLIRLSNMRS